MEGFILKRGDFRASFTKTVNALKLEISKEDFAEGIIRDKFSKLEKLNQDIEQLNERILNGMKGPIPIRLLEKWRDGKHILTSFLTMPRLVKEKLNKLVLSEEVRRVAGS